MNTLVNSDLLDLNEDQLDEINDEDNIEYLEFLEFLNKEKIDLNERINIIDPKETMYITENTKIDLSRIYHDFKAMMYYHFIIVRKISTVNSEFVKFFIPCISKVVHPNIQLFYGLMFEKEKILKSTGISKALTVINDDKDTDTIITNLKKRNSTKDNFTHNKNITLSVILELCRGIKINKLNEIDLKVSLMDNLILKLIMLRKVSQILLFLHKSNIPHLLLNSNKVYVDNEMLIKDSIKNTLINEDDSYIGCNILKLTDVGMFYSISKDLGFDLIHNDIYEIKFIHPELFNIYIDEYDYKIQNITRKNYIRYDTWSLICIILEILSEDQILNFIVSLEMIKSYYSSIYKKNNNSSKFDDYNLFIEIHGELISIIKSKYNEIANFNNMFDEMIKKVLDAKNFSGEDNNLSTYGQNHSALKYLNDIIIDLRNNKLENNTDKEVKISSIIEIEKKEDDVNNNKLLLYKQKFRSYHDYEISKFIHRTKIKNLIDESLQLNNELKNLRHDDYLTDL